jgi:hypothetical protein
MKMRVLFALLVMAALAGGDALAQEPYFFGFAYTPVLPMGKTADFTGDLSWRGGTMEGRRMVRPDVSIGFSAGWHVLNEETDEVVHAFEGLDIQGHQFRYLNIYPVLVNAHKYFGHRGGARPFIGANAGISYIERRVEIGVIAATTDAWPFTLAGDVGVAFPAGWRTAGFLFTRFHFLAEAGGLTEQTYWTFGVGLAWQ